jgi:hypothetical protein
MKTRITLLALLSAGTMLSIGCETAVIGSGTKTSATYRFGKLSSTLSADIGTSYKAADAAMQELALNVVQRVKDQLEAKFTARDSQDNRIIVDLVAISDESTKLTIQVGSLAKARRIYQAILDNTPKA